MPKKCTSEYNPTMFKDTGLPIQPRPLLKASDKLRATYRTGDPSGSNPVDPTVWAGGGPRGPGTTRVSRGF